MGMHFLLGFAQPHPDDGQGTYSFKHFEYVGTGDYPDIVKILRGMPDADLSEMSTYLSGMGFDVGDASFISYTDYPGDANNEAEFVRYVKMNKVPFGLLERLDQNYGNPEWLWTDGVSPLRNVDEFPPPRSTDKYDPMDYVRNLVHMARVAKVEPQIEKWVKQFITTEPRRVRQLVSIFSRMPDLKPGEKLAPTKLADPAVHPMRRIIDAAKGDDE